MPMLNQLSNKLTLTLLALLLVVGLAYLAMSGWIMERHIHQVHQQLHHNLASNLVTENVIFDGGGISTRGLEQVFQTLMVVNPNIEVYLLDLEGNILSYSAPYRKVKRESVDLGPIRTFIGGEASFPLWGENPRSESGHKVFSAATVESDGIPRGYLYVVLGSDQFDSANAFVIGDTMWRISGSSLFALIGFALVAGAVMFRVLTLRLRRLDRDVQRFEASCADQGIPEVITLPRSTGGPGDEIDRLYSRVAQMTHRLAEQMLTIRKTDIMRRQLVANVSHDLRTPLAALDGYLQTLMLKRESLTEPQRQEYVEIAAKSCHRLIRLVDELFELSRLEATSREARPEPFCLAELASDVLQKFQLQARQERIQLDLQVDPQASHAVAEIGLIERVLENLIANAINHTPRGGKIQLSLSPEGTDRIKIAVHDTGTGIAERDLPFIFDRFYRPDTQSEGRGVGLGLAIVKRIMDLHKSRVIARSKQGKGSSFEFWLPAFSG